MTTLEKENSEIINRLVALGRPDLAPQENESKHVEKDCKDDLVARLVKLSGLGNLLESNHKVDNQQHKLVNEVQNPVTILREAIRRAA